MIKNFIFVMLIAILFAFSCGGIPDFDVNEIPETAREEIITENTGEETGERIEESPNETVLQGDSETAISSNEENKTNENFQPESQLESQSESQAESQPESQPESQIESQAEEIDSRLEEDITQFIAEIPEAILNTEPPPEQPPVLSQTPAPAPSPVITPPSQPLITQPPVAQPPVVQPPAVQPPVTQPPAAQPPVAQSEAAEQIPEEPETAAAADPDLWRRSLDFPSGPPVRLDTLADMGMTPLDSEIIFSRIVRATVGQIVEIPFRGNGWVYLGELASRRGILYNSRRNDPEGQSFIFTLEEPGTYVLRFYRQDFIRDYILNDHVQVIAGESPQAGAGWFGPPVDRGRIVAQPRWPSAVEEAQIRSGTRTAGEPVVSGVTPPPRETTPAQSAQETTQRPAAAASQSAPDAVIPEAAPQRTSPIASSQGASQPAARPQETTSLQPPSPVAPPQPAESQTVTQTEEPSVPAPLAPGVILDRAREAFDGGNVPAAVALLEQFMESYPSGSDEVFWLFGQFYEANSPSRNILLSLDYYRRLTNEYPQSRRFNDARRRIAYLERFYINIQ